MKKLTLLIAVVVIGGIYLFLSKNQIPNSNTTGESIPFENIEKNSQSGGTITNKENFIIVEQEEWSRLWNLLTDRIFPKPELPTVDFEKESLIAVFQGQKGSGGYSIEIIEVQKIGNMITIFINESEPGSSCNTTSAMSEPYHIIKLPNPGITEADISFRYKTSINKCK